MRAEDLRPGDVILRTVYAYPDPDVSVPVEVLRPSEPCQDRFGQSLFRYWCRRGDNGKEGWMIYGKGGVVTMAPEQPNVTFLRVGSHRASARLDRALGYRPRQYFTFQREGQFALVPTGLVATLTALTGITRTRRVDDLRPCIKW